MKPKVTSPAASARKQMPLAAYSAAILVFNSLLARLVTSKRSKPLEIQEMALLGVATHKLSRIISKDVVTTPLRAPFTEFECYLGYGEVNERAREDSPARQFFGELVSCNYCLDAWVALAFLQGLERFPAPTKIAMRFFSAIAISDFLHVAYEKNRTAGNVLTLRETQLEKSVGVDPKDSQEVA